MTFASIATSSQAESTITSSSRSRSTSCATHVCSRTADPVGSARRSPGGQAARHGRGHPLASAAASARRRSRPRWPGCSERRDGAQPRRLDLDVHFGTGALALDLDTGARPDRCDREPEPDRRTVHRTCDGSRERAAFGSFGGSADPPAFGDGWHGLLPASGRNAQRVRIDGPRPSASHAYPVSAHGP